MIIKIVNILDSFDFRVLKILPQEFMNDSTISNLTRLRN